MSDHCSICKSRDITKGGLTNGEPSLGHYLFFEPPNVKFLAMTIRTGVPVEGYACRSCGFVWAATDPEALRTFMEKYCEKE